MLYLSRHLIIILLTSFFAFSSRADDVRKPIVQQDITKQETIVLGNNRFLIFSGTASERGQYGYTVDLVKIEDGIPHFDPLFIEEYNSETNQVKLEYGVAFMCLSYHFDKADNSMTYSFEDEAQNRLQLKYKLDVDIFKLDEVDSQKQGPCPQAPCAPSQPITIFKAAANAQTH